MKKLILAVLFLFCLNGFAQSSSNICSGTTIPAGGGGDHDAWPWAAARPFPWTSIQGVWTVVNSADEAQSNLVFEFKVTRTTDKIKQLFVIIYDRNACKNAFMRGVGVVNKAEKNVVRVNMNNVLLKLAMFNTSDLEMDSYTCGPRTLGATFYRLTGNDEIHMKDVVDSPVATNADSANMILKKVSNATDFRCKK